jgi:hypothetical protein
MGSHARWQVAVVAGAIGTVTVVAGGGASVAQACSTSAPCYAVEHDSFSSAVTLKTLSAAMEFTSWHLANYNAGERINLSLFSESASGSISAGATVGGTLPNTPSSTSTPLYYKRTQAGAAAPVEVSYTDGPGSGYFGVVEAYDSASNCWTISVGPHTSACIANPFSSMPKLWGTGLSTNAASSGYKATAYSVPQYEDAVYGWSSWGYLNTGTPGTNAYPAWTSPGCAVLDPTYDSLSAGVGTTSSGAPVTC